MALFQPFKKTTGRATPKFLQAELAQAQLDQQAKQHANAMRGKMYGGAIDTGIEVDKMYGDPKSAIGAYLREMTGSDMMDDPARPPTQSTGTQVAGQPSTDPTVGIANPMAPLPNAFVQTGEGAIDEAAVDQDVSFEQLQRQINSGGDVGDLLPETEAGGSMFADTYSTPENLTLEGATDMGAQVGADTGEAAADESLRGTLESVFAQFGGDAGTDAAIEGGTEALLEGGGEQLTEAATEKAAEKAGGAGAPGVGSLVSLAQGDVKGAAAKYALSMLPPPYNMLAMLV